MNDNHQSINRETSVTDSLNPVKTQIALNRAISSLKPGWLKRSLSCRPVRASDRAGGAFVGIHMVENTELINLKFGIHHAILRNRRCSFEILKNMTTTSIAISISSTFFHALRVGQYYSRHHYYYLYIYFISQVIAISN
jgi:hypothetical protein